MKKSPYEMTTSKELYKYLDKTSFECDKPECGDNKSRMTRGIPCPQCEDCGPGRRNHTEREALWERHHRLEKEENAEKQKVEKQKKLAKQPKPNGAFEEFAVDEAGMFNARYKHNMSSAYAYWTDTAFMETESDLELVFAGWVWKNVTCKILSAMRQGYDADGTLTAVMGEWAKPAQPIAVRFWRKQ